MKNVKPILLAAVASLNIGCASIVNESHIPISLSFSDQSTGTCQLRNKRGVWETEIPGVPMIRRSDDSLQYECVSEHGGKAVGSMRSYMGGEIAMSAVFLDFGITDAITDKHRYYDGSYVIPMRKPDSSD